MKEKKAPIRLLMFSLSTLGGTAVDTLVLFICSHLIFSGYVGTIIVSPIISFEAAVLTNYTTAYFLVWRDRITNRSRADYLRRFPGYNLSCVFGFLMKMLLLIAIQRFTQLDVVFCNLIALLFSGLLNFALNDRLVFSRRKSDTTKHEPNESD